MIARLRRWKEYLFSTYWFVPSLLALTATGLSFASLALDRRAQVGERLVPWLWSGGPEGAVAVLSTVAGSAITVAGTVFSVVVVALTLASNQFGPRLLRNFMRDLGNQVVLGTFIATFLFCLLVGRAVRHADGAEFTPHVSVTAALALGVLNLAVLIYFIHHAAASIQAEHVIATIGRELDRAEPPPALAPPSTEGAPADFDRLCRTVTASRSGYAITLDEEALVELAARADAIVRPLRRPGDFVTRGAPLAEVYPSARWSPALARDVNAAYALDDARAPLQDAAYAIDQLVEVALRSLSPGVNDPFTAIACIDWLGVALARATDRPPSPAHRHDARGRLRLIVPVTTFDDLAGAVLDPLRQYSAGHVRVTWRLLEMIETVALQARTLAQRELLARHAGMIVRGAERSITEPGDLRAVQALARRVETSLTPGGA